MEQNKGTEPEKVSEALRRQAEQWLQSHRPAQQSAYCEEDAQRLIHELEVHQIELEMQNEELRQARENLERALETYSDLYDFAPVGYVTLNSTGCIRAINLTGAALLGLERSRLINRDFDLFVAAEHQETFDTFLDRAFASTGKETCELELVTNGTARLVAQLEAMASTARDACQMAVIDISKRKQLERHLLQAQKMETVGLLAGGIAHDFNNILSVIAGYCYLAESKLQGNEPLMFNMKQILAAANRGENLTKSLLNFSRKHLISPHPVDVNEIIRTVDTLLNMVLGEDVQLHTVSGETVLMVTADSGQIEQVLANLATNARHAMPDGGTLTITSESCCITSESVTAQGMYEPGNYALITVTDTGTGMSRETVSKIFEPFFTTKTLGNGTGLGLSIVYSLITQHGGYIDVSSELGTGTTFRIYLPLISAADIPRQDAQPLLSRPEGGSETILLAEDDTAVRHMTEQILAEFGYRIIAAENGDEAVQKFLQHKAEVNLLLFDLIMPHRNGKEAYDAICAICPGMPVLFMSGYTNDIVQAKTLTTGLELIEKPFSSDDLARRVRAKLDAQASCCSS
jgi:PAS domain S-box-containing protein